MTDLIKAGLVLLLITTGLALVLLHAAYQRAAVSALVAPEDLLPWALLAISVGGLLLLLALQCSQRFACLSLLRGRSGPLLTLAVGGCLAVLLLFHLRHAGEDQALLLAGGTALLIAALVAIELGVLVLSREGAQASGCAPYTLSAPAQKVGRDYRVMRPAIFLFLFGIDLSMSFIPLHMEQMADPLFGLSPDLVMSLPISVEFFCVGVALLLCGVWLDRRGWQEPFYCGLLLAGIGSLYSWLATDAVQFILARGVLGLGYGLSLLAAQGFVIRQTDASNKARGLAHLFAGLYSGSICGAASGAVMAEHFGYGPVFLIGALLVFAVIIYGLWFIRTGVTEARPEEPSVAAVRQQPVSRAVIGFLLNRRVLAAIVFSSMPASIAVVGFLNYFSPVYLNRAGASDATIGQVLMLFGVCLTLFGPGIGRLADRCRSKRIPIVVGGGLGSCAFLVFTVLDGVAAVSVAVLLLGLSNCFVLSAQSAYVLQQQVTVQLGDGKAMGIFRSSSRIGQMLGPLVFAGVILLDDIEAAVTWLGIGYLLVVVLFLLLAGRDQAALPQTLEKGVV